MSERSASNTAYGVAVLRLAHQLLDSAPRILVDPIIGRMLGPEAEQNVREGWERLQSPGARGLRSHVVLRSRFTEDALEQAVTRGMRQYVLLGAGYDTFAHRQPAWARDLQIIEVDHPASQRAKLALLEKAGVASPPNLRYADIDFEHETLRDGLKRCGVSFDIPTFFSWLGVTMYLTREAIDAVLSTVASFPKGSEITLTFAQPNEPGDDQARELAVRAASVGEPWLSYFTPSEIEALLRAHGFSDVYLPSRDEIVSRYYENRADELRAPRRISLVDARL